MPVLFIDMDYFFAACEELRHPELKARAFVVGTGTIAKREKGVVQTCNYEARKYGIRSAMPTSQALRLKPDLVYLESDDEYYSLMSSKVMDLLKGYGFTTEVISVDEAAIDLTETDYKDSERLAKEIKERVRKELGLPCTIGVSTGKIYAKMACDSAKPNGIMILKESEIQSFLKDRDVQDILGVGKKTADRLRSMGIENISQLAASDPNRLVEGFGSFGRELYALANGKDDSRVVANYTIMSIGRERTLDRNTKNLAEIDKTIRSLSEEVVRELAKQGFWFKGVSAKAKYSDFTERIRNKKLGNYTDSQEILQSTAMQLVRELMDERSIRKVGVRVYNLDKRKGQRKIF